MVYAEPEIQTDQDAFNRLVSHFREHLFGLSWDYREDILMEEIDPELARYIMKHHADKVR